MSWEVFEGNRVIPVDVLKTFESVVVKDGSFDVKKGIIEGVPRAGKIKREESKDPTCKIMRILEEKIHSASTWKERLDFIKDIISGIRMQRTELIIIDEYLQLASKNMKHTEKVNDYYNNLLSVYHTLINELNKETLEIKENNLVIRSILKRLPAFSGAFASFIPSTQVKELLERDDVPADLKEQISSILHDKFSTCANLCDLEAALKTLSAIRRSGTCGSEFVAAFERFVEEFGEFFKSSGLDLLLTALAASLEAENYMNCVVAREGIENFLSAKKSMDASPLNCVKSLSALRSLLADLKKGSASPSIYAHAWNADLQLESYLRVVLGLFLASATLPLRNDEELDSFLHIILYALRNLKFSDYEAAECSCIESGLLLFISMTSNTTLYYLRLKSVLERTERILLSILACASPPSFPVMSIASVDGRFEESEVEGALR